MLQEFHKKGGDINARDGHATPQPDLPIFSSGRKCSELCPRVLPFWPEISAFGLPPYPLTPFSLGVTPTQATPPQFCFIVFFPACRPPHLCRVPLVHAAAAWHRIGRTPLMYAARKGSTDALALLVQLRAAVDAQHKYG